MPRLDTRPTAVRLQIQTFEETRATQDVTGARELAASDRRFAEMWTREAVDTHDGAVERDLDNRAAAHARQGGLDLLEELSTAGLAWRDIARLVGVSVPAVQKWRRGQAITGANRSRLAQVAAVIERLGELVQDPASWLETPVKDEVHVVPLDLLVAAKDRVVVLFGEGHCSVEDFLTEYDPDWRLTRVDGSFETIVDVDGQRSIRPRS